MEKGKSVYAIRRYNRSFCTQKQPGIPTAHELNRLAQHQESQLDIVQGALQRVSCYCQHVLLLARAIIRSSLNDLICFWVGDHRTPPTSKYTSIE